MTPQQRALLEARATTEGMSSNPVGGILHSMRLWTRAEAEALSAALTRLDNLEARIERIDRYADKLNDLEIAPNGDDFNNIHDFSLGRPYSPPHVDGR